MARRAGASAVLCAVVVIAAVGCGSSDSKKFVDDYNKVVKKNSTLASDVGSAITGAPGKTDAQLAKQFDDLAARTRREADDLDKLSPPDSAGDELDALVKDLRPAAGHLSDVASAARAHSSSKARTATQALVNDSEALAKEEDALKKAVK
jgi:hypothetical protein